LTHVTAVKTGKVFSYELCHPASIPGTGRNFFPPFANFEAFTAVMFLVDVFWVVTLCGVVVGGSMDL
jgi:hypothetical protein